MAKPMYIATHEKVCTLVRRLIPPGAKILEVSCGSGRNLAVLREAGYTVRGTNFSQHDMFAQGLDIDLGVDVMKSLPYEDDSFDCVLLCDVIEHLSDHAATVENLSRIVKPGGRLIVITPNTNRINSRLHFLFTGFLKVKRSFIGFDVPADQAWAFHNYPPHLPTFIYLLHSQGLDTTLDAIEVKPKSVFMWLLFFPMIYLITRYKLFRSEKFLRDTPAAKHLMQLVTSWPALNGEAIVFNSTKRTSGEASQPMKTTLPEWHKKIEEEE